MDTEFSDNKLLDIDDEELDVYIMVAKSLAGKFQSFEHVWQMNYQDLFGECMLEVAKGLKVYRDRPAKERITVIKSMMFYRMKEIRHRCFITHRAAEVNATRIDDDDSEDIAGGYDTEELAYSRDRVLKTFEMLSPVAKKVLESVLYGNERLNSILGLAALRKQETGSYNVQPKIRAAYVSDALLIPIGQVESAIREIRKAYAEVCKVG